METAKILVKFLRSSTSCQYDSVWSSFCNFVRDKNFDRDSEVVFSFLQFLFEVQLLVSVTVGLYHQHCINLCCMHLIFMLVMLFIEFFVFDSLPYLFSLFFGRGVTLPLVAFNKIIKAFFLIRLNKPAEPISWSLGKVSNLCLSNAFQNTSPIVHLTSASLFLLALATGDRVSKLLALPSGVESVVFDDD